LVEQRMPAPAGAAPAALGGPAVPSGTAAGELALRRLWEALRRNLGLVLGTVLLLDIAAAAWLLVRPLEWTATAELLIEADERNFGNLRDEVDFRVDRLQPADLESEVKPVSYTHLTLPTKA
jgi:uncharacterized protein involved in exopolysaccharide biosynthesis